MSFNKTQVSVKKNVIHISHFQLHVSIQIRIVLRLLHKNSLKLKSAYYTGFLRMNGAVSKVNKKFISHLTRAQRIPSAEATVQVSHALPAVRSLVLTAGLRGHLVN